MIKRLEPKHWALIASFLASTATVIAGFDHWGDMTKPAVIAGILMQLATLIGAVFAGAPPNPHLGPHKHPGRRVRDASHHGTSINPGYVSDGTRTKL